MLVPTSRMSEALGVFDENFDLYPLWICPYRAYDYSTPSDGTPHRCFLKKPKAVDPQKGYEMYVDLGAVRPLVSIPRRLGDT